MKVIKVVSEEDGKLVSAFARGKWEKEYAEGVETKPDIGYLFAYSSRNMETAKRQMGSRSYTQYWSAEAKVVGRIRNLELSMASNSWRSFWKGFKLRLQREKAGYLLCSSITLVRRLA